MATNAETPVRVEPPDAAAGDATAKAIDATTAKDTHLKGGQKLSRLPTANDPDTTELSGKPLAAAFAGMMVSSIIWQR